MRVAPNTPILETIRRNSVADQVAEVFRRAIEHGVWRHQLPSEHELATRFKVSRPSVHTALVKLQADGIVTIRHGRRTRIVSPRPAQVPPPIVCWLAPAARKAVDPDSDHVILTVRNSLAEQGIGWDEIFDPNLRGKEPASHLQRIVRQRHRICWILDSSSLALQQWFCRAGIPAFVFGTCHPGTGLPSIDIDYRAVGLHAGGAMARLGHSRVGVIMPQNPFPGDLACYDSMLESMTVAGRVVHLSQVRAGLARGDLQAKLGALLSRREPPTVLFFMLLGNALEALFYLQERRIRVPADLSIICRDTHPLIDQGMSELTRYHASQSRIANAVVRMVQALLSGRQVPAEPVLISPRFIPGRSLARADSPPI